MTRDVVHFMLVNGVSSSTSQRWVCSKSDLCSTTKCERNNMLTIMNLATPKAGTKHEVLFNKSASDAYHISTVTARPVCENASFRCNQINRLKIHSFGLTFCAT